MNLSEYVQDPYEKKLHKFDEISQIRSKQMDVSSCSWVGKFNIIKIPILHNLIYRLTAIPIKISKVILWISTTDSKIYTESKDLEQPAHYLGVKSEDY